MNLFIYTLTELWLTIVILHDIESFVDGSLVFQREHQPTTQKTSTHGAHRLIYHIEQ